MPQSDNGNAYSAGLCAAAETWEAGSSPDEFMAAVVWDFAAYLDDKVTTPSAFIMAREHFVFDTRTGVNRNTREPLHGTIDAFPPDEYDSGYPPDVYDELRKQSLGLARTAFGDVFADEAEMFAARLIGATDEPFPNDIPGRKAA